MNIKEKLKQKVLIQNLLKRNNQNLNDKIADEVIRTWLSKHPDLTEDYLFSYDGVDYDTTGTISSGMITLFMQLIKKSECIKNVTISFENGSVMNFEHVY